MHPLYNNEDSSQDGHVFIMLEQVFHPKVDNEHYQIIKMEEESSPWEVRKSQPKSAINKFLTTFSINESFRE